MNQNFWGKVSIVGASGKMGRGIAIVLLQEMARQHAEDHGSVEGGASRLNLIDVNEEQVFSLRRFLKPLITRYAEKYINELRSYYSKNQSLVSNKEIIDAFVEGALDMVHCDVHTSAAKGSQMVFEAVTEDVDIKDSLYLELREFCGENTHFFSNTSSIPIHVLNSNGKLDNRIIGFHFYNPPQKQQLIELIIPEETDSETCFLAEEVASRLNKKIVYSADVAGFIGNGFLIQEIAFACEQVERMRKNYPIHMAISLVDAATRDFLFRPMGIFQLIDYVGIDVCYQIASIMEEYNSVSHLKQPLLKKMLERGIKGGQGAGFFDYYHLSPQNVYSLEIDQYCTIPEEITAILGKPPSKSWKQLSLSKHRSEELAEQFHQLEKDPSLGFEIACTFLEHSKKVAQNLVTSGIAESLEDVDTVLELGFGHLYGSQHAVMQL